MSTCRTTVGLLGPVAAGPTPDQLTEVPGLRAKRLLASLALASGRYVSADRLVEDVWGGRAPSTAALHTQVSRLRQTLTAVAPGAVLESGPAGYRLTGVTTDLEVGESDSSSAHWRGEPGADLGDDPGGVGEEVRRRAARLARLRDDRDLAAALAAGDYTAARRIAEIRCTADPLDEPAHVALMRAAAGEGNVPEALATFDRLRRALASELGVDPGPEAAALHTRLLAGDGDSPPMIPADAASVGLRAEPSDLIGRGDDVSAVVDLTERHRVVTVQGPGGVGKTRIAHTVGNALSARGRTVYFVALAPVTDPEAVPGAVASVVGIGETDRSPTGRPRIPAGPLTARLAAALRDRAAVLILDNCEHVIDAAAALVGELAAAAPSLTVVTTSRGPLMVPGERIYPLPVLSADGPDSPAVQLFTLRAQAIRPGATLDPGTVADLCRALDGLPLAIELAAARVRTMTVPEIAAGLSERFALLRTADRTTEPRHRTLFAVIDWSWELLDERARRALRRLCRFPGGFAAEAAAAVLADSSSPDGSGFRPAVQDALSALVDQSLLHVTDDGEQTRYRMLETVREFGAERLADAGDDAEVYGAMASWGRSVATRARRLFDTDDHTGLLELMSVEAENLQWILLHATDTGDVDTVVSLFPALSAFWAARGLRGDAGAWTERVLDALDLHPTGLSEEQRQAWQATVLACGPQALVDRRTRAVAHSRLLLRRLYRPELATVRLTDFLSSLALARDLHTAFRLLLEGIRSADRDIVVTALSMRQNLRENAGNIDGAIRDAVLLRRRAAVAPWARAMTASNEAGLYGQRGRWSEALPIYRTAAKELDLLGAPMETAQIRCYVVCTLAALGEVEEARRELEGLEGYLPASGAANADPEHRTALLVVHAEVALAAGEDPLPTLREAADRLLREELGRFSDPGLMMLISRTACGLVLAGDAATAHKLLPMLSSSVENAVSTDAWYDLPQGGTAALAAGFVLASTHDDSTGDDRPARLALFGMRLGSRLDSLILDRAHREARERCGLPAADWDALAEKAAHTPRRQAANELLAVLASIPEARSDIGAARQASRM